VAQPQYSTKPGTVMADLLQSIQQGMKNWWLLLIAGLIFILAGIIILVHPLSTFLTVAVFFGIAILMGGIVKIIFAISNRNHHQSWGWTLISGIISVVIGLVLANNPAISLVILPFILGFYVLYAGGMLISMGIHGQHMHLTGSGWIIFGGVITLLLGLGILFNPVTGVVVLTTIAGFSFIAEGITYSIIAFKINKARQRLAA
jgi:uncharacterized membrane protein HdeD (DUF308 family)